MRSRVRAFALVVVLTAGIAVPASGAPTDRDPSGLEVARDELEGAERELAEVEQAVRHANDEVAALDDRLRSATTELAQVSGQLERAEAALAAALDTERSSAADLAAADDHLRGLVDEWDEQRSRLERRAVHAYKHGALTPHDLLVRGVTGASDWHEVAVTLETVGRLVQDDRGLADDTATLARDTAGSRATVGDARRLAVAAARTAATEQRRVEELVTRQERVVADVEEHRSRRAAVLASLESDAAAKAILVRELERSMAELELAAMTVLIPVTLDLDVHGPPPAWAAGLPAAAQPWAAAIEAIGAQHGIDGRLLASLVWAESGFRPDAVSHAGAMGLAQLMPGTARGLGVDPRDPLQNLAGGARYLRIQLDRFGRVDLALAAYNAGPGRVQAVKGVPDIVETQMYVVRVLERYRKLSGL